MRMELALVGLALPLWIALSGCGDDSCYSRGQVSCERDAECFARYGFVNGERRFAYCTPSVACAQILSTAASPGGTCFGFSDACKLPPGWGECVAREEVIQHYAPHRVTPTRMTGRLSMLFAD
jgi:hypothetical protein